MADEYQEKMMVASGVPFTPDEEHPYPPDPEEVEMETIKAQPGGGTDLDGLDLSTNESSDDDLFVTKEDGGTAWVKKSFLKIWNYIKSKIQASSNEVAYGTCITAAGTATKDVTLDTAGNWTLKKGCRVCVKFTNTNTFSATAESPCKLNVNNTGAKNIYWGDSGNPTGTNITAFGRANYINEYVYDGTYWVWGGSSADNNTTYSAMSQTEANTGTATSARTITAQVLRNAAVPTTSSNPTITNLKDFWTTAEALMGTSRTCMFRCKVQPNFGLGNGWYRFIVSEQNVSGNGSYDIEGSIIRISGGGHITYYSVSNGKDNKDNLVIQRTNNYLPERHILTGSGTAGQDKGSGASPRYFPAKWTFNTGITIADGDVVYIKIPVAGHDYGVYVSVDNGTNYYPVVLQGTGRLTTHYTVGDYIQLQFQSDGSAANMFPLNGGDSRITVNDGVFRVVNYRDSNNSVRQYPASTTNADYRVLLSNGANDNDETNLTRKDTNFKYNPSTNNLMVGKINGSEVGSSPKFTDTTYGVVSKTANGLVPQLPNETTTTKYLRQDGTWVVPPNTNTTYTIATGDGDCQIKVTPSSGNAYNVNVKNAVSASTLTTNVNNLNTAINKKASLSGAYFTGDVNVKGSISVTDGTNYRGFLLGTWNGNTKALNVTAPIQSNYGWLELCAVNASSGISLKGVSVEAKNYANTANVIMWASAFNTASSRRYKENIHNLAEEEAEKILDVDIVTFDYKHGVGIAEDDDRFGKIGVIAEDVVGICPEVASYKEIDGEMLPDGVDYSKFVPRLIKLVQMQQAEINELKEEINALKTE